jgi:hypothetical protein
MVKRATNLSEKNLVTLLWHLVMHKDPSVRWQSIRQSLNEAILSKNPSDAKLRAEAAFQRIQKREAEINGALKEEQVRHAAAVKNMHRLRELRLARNATPNKVVRADTPKSSEGRHAHARGPTTKT